MTNENYRQQSRRKIERRSNERRILAHQFMSTEWLDDLKKGHLSGPKYDRRANNRRIGLRRSTLSRRMRIARNRMIPEIINDQSESLTKGERSLLIDILNQNISN